MHSRDTVRFVNARVFTGAGEDDFADGFTVADGRFVQVGGETGTDTDADGVRTVDLGGRTVLPGMLDLHTHPSMMSTIADAVSLLPPTVDSLASMLDALRAHPGLGGDDWIIGFGYDESGYPEGRKPTADDLDRVSTTQPVFAWRCDGHSGVVNRRALEVAGLHRDTPDPPGARYGRFPDGELNGHVIEVAAVDAVTSARPVPSRADQVAALISLKDHFLSRGIVAVDDLLATFVADPLELFRAAADADFPLSCGLYLGWEAIKHRLDEIGDLTDDHRTGRIRINGVKLFMDGAYSDRTAWTEDAYPGTDDDHGMHTLDDADLHAAVDWARRNQVQIAVHAMGDRGINHLIDTFADTEPWLSDVPSIRIDHATLVGPDMIRRLAQARMRFAVVTHTVFFFAEYDNYAANLNADQFAVAYPIRSLYAGVPALALSSDNPATAWDDADNVFLSVQAAVRRRAYNGADIGQAEAVSVGQALLLYTARAATVSRVGDLGRIAPGLDASFVVTDRDPFQVPADGLGSVRVDETWIRGCPVYTRADR